MYVLYYIFVRYVISVRYFLFTPMNKLFQYCPHWESILCTAMNVTIFCSFCLHLSKSKQNNPQFSPTSIPPNAPLPTNPSNSKQKSKGLFGELSRGSCKSHSFLGEAQEIIQEMTVLPCRCSFLVQLSEYFRMIQMLWIAGPSLCTRTEVFFFFF